LLEKDLGKCVDIMTKLKELRQTTTVDQNHNVFDVFINCLNLSEFDMVNYFMEGLKKDHQIGGLK